MMEEKAEILLKGAIQLFMGVSIKSVSMDDVARELKVSKKTLYQHFKNKEDLLTAMLNYYIENDHTKYIEESSQPFENAIDELLVASRWVSINFKTLNSVHVFDLKKYYPEIYTHFWKRKREQVYQSVKVNLERGIDEGLYRGEIRIELTAGLYARKLEQVHFQDDEILSKYSFEEVFRSIFESHIRSICNERGLAYFETRKQDFIS